MDGGTMADVAARSAKLIRCPVCLHSFTISAAAGATLRCPLCRRTFNASSALSAPLGPAAKALEPAPEYAGRRHIVVAALIIIAVTALVSGIGYPMRGPEFLLLYL